MTDRNLIMNLLSGGNSRQLNLGAVWTDKTTSTLIKLYEKNIKLFESPRKKKRIWIAVSEELTKYGIKVTSDQVRWKINALTKRYRQCIEPGIRYRFKHFKEMDNIYSHYNYCYAMIHADSFNTNKKIKKIADSNFSNNKANIEIRKIRLENRIESENSQNNLLLERQWLDYLHRQSVLRKKEDEFIERTLIIRKEEIEFRKKELEIMQCLELKKLQMQKKAVKELLQLEREKCELLELYYITNQFQ